MIEIRTFRDLLRLFFIFFREFKLAVIATLVVVLLGAFLLPTSYESSARLLIKPGRETSTLPIEMADRQAEWYWMATIAGAVRHTHPGLATLEVPQFPEFGQVQARRVRESAARFDAMLAQQPYWAGDRFTIADITAFTSIEFARGLLKFRAGEEGFAHLQAWRDRVAERPSAQV